MKNFLIFLSGFNFLLAKEINLELNVVDETGQPVSSAHCVLQFKKIGSDKIEVINSDTSSKGDLKATANTLESLYIEVNKSGYYQARLYDIPSNQDFKQTVKLSSKINPIALYVRHHTGNQSEGLKFPSVDEWYEYDLKVGDWIQPMGKGITPDFKMRLHCEEKSLSHTYLELEAVDTSAGFQPASEIILYSELKLPHHAPQSNYTKRIVINGADWENYQGVFLRSRVQVDKYGDIISANYGKIQGPIILSRRGTIGLTHYFNGTPNDRNLEFDPSKNLLKQDNELTSPRFEP